MQLGIEESTWPTGGQPMFSEAIVAAPVAAGERIFEVTGTGKFPVWQWAAVIPGHGFLLEIRIPVQSGDHDPGTALPAIAAGAYRRAAVVLASLGR